MQKIHCDTLEQLLDVVRELSAKGTLFTDCKVEGEGAPTRRLLSRVGQVADVVILGGDTAGAPMVLVSITGVTLTPETCLDLHMAGVKFADTQCFIEESALMRFRVHEAWAALERAAFAGNKAVAARLYGGEIEEPERVEDENLQGYLEVLRDLASLV